MDPPTRSFLERQFSKYYQETPSYHVREVARREWMVESHAGAVTRYLCHRDSRSLARGLASGAPRHVYHSVGYYDDPTCRTSGRDAKRTGADVLIDIDRKPGPPPRGHGYATLNDALDGAKLHARRLIRALGDDLGIRPKDYEIHFSGSKGYHFRFTTQRMQALSKEERVSLGRVLAGSNTRIELLFPASEDGDVHIPAKAPRGGLPRRIHEGLTFIERKIRHGDPLALVPIMDRHNTSLTPSETILAMMAKAPGLSAFLNEYPSHRSLLVDMARSIRCPELDQPVLGNMNGMMRLSGSINGKTGLLCQRLASSDGLETFDPVEDATPFPRDEAITVVGIKPFSLRSREDEWRMKPNQAQRLPVHAAMPFLCSGAARLP